MEGHTSKHTRFVLRVNLAVKLSILPWRQSDIDSSITIYNIMPWCCVFGCSEGDGTIFMHRFPSKDSIKKKWVVKYYERLKEKFKM